MTSEFDAHDRYNRTIKPFGAEAQARHTAETALLSYDKMALNDGGIHCSTRALVRAPVG